MLQNYAINWCFGWTSILAGFLCGAIIGMWFHRDAWLGGYASLPRRMLRLGHIALVALGGLNVLFAVATPVTAPGRIAAALFISGGATMPLVCFLTAIHSRFRHLFFIPVASLIAAVVLVLVGGTP